MNRYPNRLRPALLSCALLLASACASGEPSSAKSERGEPQASTARPSAGAEQAGAHESRAPGAPLSFAPRPGWIERAPTSALRAAEYLLPGAGGAGQAELVVFYFGAGQGGSVEANLERWAGQFEQPDGADSLERVRRSQRRVGDLAVHELALEGTYVAETSPGSGQRVREPGWALLAAIVESDHGPYYLKLTGPEATVRARAGEFRAFVSELR